MSTMNMAYKVVEILDGEEVTIYGGNDRFIAKSLTGAKIKASNLAKMRDSIVYLSDCNDHMWSKNTQSGKWIQIK